MTAEDFHSHPCRSGRNPNSVETRPRVLLMGLWKSTTPFPAQFPSFFHSALPWASLDRRRIDPNRFRVRTLEAGDANLFRAKQDEDADESFSYKSV